jgi:hypothetical protein
MADGSSLFGEKPGGCFAEPAAGAGDDHNFSFDVVVYGLSSSVFINAR